MSAFASKTDEIWARYVWLRDNGHSAFIEKAYTCENFWAGNQWKTEDSALLKAVGRPALTINKILATIAVVLGEQITNRTEISFKPRNKGATTDTATALTKLFMQISDNNLLPWTRSDVFADGVISGRGFYDVRLDFSDSVTGEVRVEHLNPKNVLIDASADKYDPDTWNDIIVTKWLSADEIEMLYGKDKADSLRITGGADNPYATADDDPTDHFGTQRPGTSGVGTSTKDDDVSRLYRVIERQKRDIARVDSFVHLERGDVREVPPSWTEQQKNDYLEANPGVAVMKRMVRKIRWTVIAGNVILHDDWSPYKHFTIVPFFPYFLRGKTIGIVENLLGPQELLNKVRSQELHVVNTTANSGWKVKAGSLTNMTVGELEQRGAETGLVLELDNMDSAEKIAPNQVPTGLDRISYKAEEDIKTISAISDYMSGQAREDVSAKALQMNQQRGAGNLTKVMDNMSRTEWLLARVILSIVQEFYTEPRILYITKDKYTSEVEPLELNQMSPEGEIINDLTLGEYGIVVTSQPERDTLADGQLAQLVSLRKDLGIAIPDKFIIQASNAQDKNEIIQAMEGAANSPEAQQQQAEMADLQKRAAEAEIAVNEAKAAESAARANLARIEGQSAAQGGELNGEVAKATAELRKAEQQTQLAREKMAVQAALAREKNQGDLALKQQVAGSDAERKDRDAAHKRATNYLQAKQKTAEAAKKPKKATGAKK
jgi:hypothetical protein